MCPIILEPHSELSACEVINRKLVKHAVIVLERALVIQDSNCVVTSENLAMSLKSAEFALNNVREAKLRKVRQRADSWRA